MTPLNLVLLAALLPVSIILPQLEILTKNNVMMQVIYSVLGHFAFPVGVVFLLRGWITQRLKQSIKSEYDKELASHKSALELENKKYIIEFESKVAEAKHILQHNLELARLERQIRYSGTFTKQLEAVQEIFDHIVKVQNSMNNYTSIFESSGGPSKEDLRKESARLIGDFWNIFNSCRILIPKELDRQITCYIQLVQDRGIEFMFKVEQRGADDLYEQWNEINKDILAQWNTTLEPIRAEFRKILGVEANLAGD